MNREELYLSLKEIIQTLYPDLIILKSLREGESDPNLEGDVDVYCVIQQKYQKNLHISQGPVLVEDNGEKHGIQTFQNRKVVIQFDFFGKDEFTAIEKANECNQWLCEKLIAEPQNYNFSLLGDVGDVYNNSDLIYGKKYKYRYTFLLELFIVDSVTGPCTCLKLPEKIIIQDSEVIK